MRIALIGTGQFGRKHMETDGAGRAIPGLYACGNDMASIFLGSYPGPGTTLGPALVFAYLAARHAAA